MRKYHEFIMYFVGVASFTFMAETCAMEATMEDSPRRDHESRPALSLAQPTTLKIPFDCFHNSKVICSGYLLEKHSVLFRNTLNRLFEMRIYSNDDVTKSEFQDLSSDITKSLHICEQWDHVALPLFNKINTLLQQSAKKKNPSKRIPLQTCLTKFKEQLAPDATPDACELKLIYLYWDDHRNTKEAMNLAERLVDEKREEVAIHYLLMLGEKIQLPYGLAVAANPHLCEETKQMYNYAEKLGSKEAKRRIEEVAKDAENLISELLKMKTDVSEEEGWTQSVDDNPSNSTVSITSSAAS